MNFRKKNGGLIRPKWIFFNSSGGFGGSQTFFTKKKSPLSLFIFSFIFPCLASSLSFSSLPLLFLFSSSSLLFSSPSLPLLFSSLLFPSLLFSSLLSLLFSSLLLSCLVLSCLVFSCLLLSSLVFSCLLLSCFVPPLSSSLVFQSLSRLLLCFLLLSLSLSSFSVSLCLSLLLSPHDAVCCVLWCMSLWSWCYWWSCCVFVCVLRHAEKTWKKPVCGFKNASVCAFKTSPCVRSKCPRVYGHHAHMCFNMYAWCLYTR